MVLLWPSAARALAPEEVTVRARVGPRWTRVVGVMEARVRLDGGERSVGLWLYGDRLRAVPSALDERTARWIYPGEVDRGGVEVSSVSVDGRAVDAVRVAHPRGHPKGLDVAGVELRVPVEAGSERAVTVRVAFVLTVPARFGRLGRADRMLSLAAPWYPLVIDGDAWRFDALHRVELTADRGEVLLGGERRVRAVVRAPYVPAAVAARWTRRVLEVPGVDAVRWSPRAPYAPPPPERTGDAGLADIAEVDILGLSAETVSRAVEGARALGVPLPPRVRLVVAPSRTELAATAPGLVLVSDRLFQIFPLDQSRAFHRRALRRAAFRSLAEAAYRRADPPADRGWAADLRAVALLDLDQARRDGRTVSPQELLGALAFHPAVDQLLYAPQIAFEDVYFAAIAERDPYREDPVRSRRPLARGRRLLEAARDALAPDAFAAFVAGLLDPDRGAREALAAAAPTGAERLDGWLASPGEPLNYRLGRRASVRLPDGSYRHRVTVHRDGAGRAEPVEVEVVDEQGHRAVAVWDAPGPVGEVEVELPAQAARVTVDPRHRLVQDPSLADGHPRADDTTSLPWRPPILNGFALSLLASEGDVIGFVDFALRRRYDLDHTIGLRVQRTRAFTGGVLSYAQGVGPKVHTNRRVGSIAGGVTFDRLHSFFGDSNLGGWRVQGLVSLAMSTVSFVTDPRQGAWGRANVVGGVAFRDDGTVGYTLRGAGRIGGVIPLGLTNALVLVGGGGFTAGRALSSELQTLGGAARLRGFATPEILGRGALFGIAEHRWTFLRDLSINVAHLVWVRELQLALFGGTGVAFDVEGQEGGGARGAADAGLGLRVHYDYGGVQPGVMVLDLAFPLTRRVTDRGAPVAFYLAFDQFF
ncbi:MAG: hypothetical protein ACFCGT_12940 [Sandaracinaceae bacterium]